MLNRALEIKLVKKQDSKSTFATPQEVEPTDYEAIAIETFDHISTRVAIGVAGYIALTTLSKVIIKLTPAH